MPTIYTIPDDVTGSVVTIDGKSHTVTQVEQIHVSGSATNNATLPFSNTAWVAFKFTAPANSSSLTWQTVAAWLTASGNSPDVSSQVELEIHADAAGSPGSLLSNGRSHDLNGNGLPTTGTPTKYETIFDAPLPVPANSTAYWLVVYMAGSVAGTYGVAYDNSAGANIIATSSNSGSTWGTVGGTGYFQFGNGGGAALVGNSFVGRALDAETINGTAVYASATGTKSYAGYFKVGPGCQGLWIDSNTPAAAGGITVYGNVARFDVGADGNASMPGLKTDIFASGTTTLTVAKGTVIVNASSQTITLPQASAAGSGRCFAVKNKNGVTGTTVQATSCNVENGATYSLASALNGAIFQSDGANYWIIASI